MSDAPQKNIEVKTGENSTVTIEGELPFADLEKHKTAAIKHLGKDIEVDGFRKGHIPENVLEERVGEMAILSEMAERALAEVYPEIVKEHELDVIGYPDVKITKLAKDNPLGFSATVATVPEVTLPDVKAIAKEQNTNKEPEAVTDEEVEKQVADILRQKVAYERLQQKAAKEEEGAKERDENVTELPTPESVQESAEEASEPEIPELTDELVQGLGQPGQFTDVADFKAKIREHLETQKKQEAAAKHRAAITDAIIDASEMELPEVLVEAELNQMFAQMEQDLKRAQLSMDDYLTHVKKSTEDLKTEWRPSAEKRAKLQLVLNAIAKEHDIEPDAAAVEQEVEQLLEQFKDADESRVRTYVASVLTNEAVMKMLEEQTT